MALLAPDKIEGIIPLGSPMDYESERTRNLGCWGGIAACTGPTDAWTSTEPTPDFEPGDAYCELLVNSRFGADCKDEVREFWWKTINESYSGDAVRRRARMAAINLRERDGLHGRLGDVRCPVLWMHGTSDVVYSVRNAQEEIQLFVNARGGAKLVIIDGGAHFFSASHPKEVDQAALDFITEWRDKHV